MSQLLRSGYRRGRDKVRACLPAPSTLKRGKRVLLRLLPLWSLSLFLLGVSGVALAAPASVSGAPAGAPAALRASAPQGYSNANSRRAPPNTPTPICQAGTDTATQCAQHLTSTLSSGAQAFYVVGVWVAVVVAILVVIWTTPMAIMGAASNNSKVIGQLAARIAIIVALLLLAINSWTILSFFLGSSSQTISPPSFPTVSGG